MDEGWEVGDGLADKHASACVLRLIPRLLPRDMKLTNTGPSIDESGVVARLRKEHVISTECTCKLLACASTQHAHWGCELKQVRLLSPYIVRLNRLLIPRDCEATCDHAAADRILLGINASWGM